MPTNFFQQFHSFTSNYRKENKQLLNKKFAKSNCFTNYYLIAPL